EGKGRERERRRGERKVGANTAMAATATLARALRGGRGYGAGSNLVLPLMTGIGRRAPLQRADGLLLLPPGTAGSAGGRRSSSALQQDTWAIYCIAACLQQGMHQ
ncbi:unnamed protein product, partial [Urochloa humidicola]